MAQENGSLGGILSRVVGSEIRDDKPDFASVYAESNRRRTQRSASNRHRLMLAIPIAAAFVFALPLSFLALSSRSATMRAAVSELSSFSLRDVTWEDGIYGLALETAQDTEMSEFIGDIWNL